MEDTHFGLVVEVALLVTIMLVDSLHQLLVLSLRSWSPVLLETRSVLAQELLRLQQQPPSFLCLLLELCL